MTITVILSILAVLFCMDAIGVVMMHLGRSGIAAAKSFLLQELTRTRLGTAALLAAISVPYGIAAGIAYAFLA